MTPNDNALAGLPIIVGVTGHRDPRPADVPALEAAVEALFDRLARQYPATKILVLTPLAEGGDQLVARVARRRGIAYRVPLPMPLESYREDFLTPETRAEFDDLLSAADGPPFCMPYFADNDASNIVDADRRARQYAMVGAYIARTSHVLIALWNGFPANAVGGCAQIVRYRIFGVPKIYLARRSELDAPEIGPVYQIYTARVSDASEILHPPGSAFLRGRFGRHDVLPATENIEQLFALIEERPPDSPDPFAPKLFRINEFNEDCKVVPDPPAGAAEPWAMSRLLAASEKVATYYQKRTVLALRVLFLATAAAAICLETYAHLLPGAHAIAFPYVVLLLVAVAAYSLERRGHWQDRSQDYRALEMGLLVQQTWNAAGLGNSVADFYIRGQRSELDWIREAIRTAHDLDPKPPLDDASAIAAVRGFVVGQYAYFAGNQNDPRLRKPGVAPRPGSAARERAKNEIHEMLAGRMWMASFVGSLLLVGFATALLVDPTTFDKLAPPETIHAYLIVFVALTAIAAALFHDYPQRRAHRFHARRYEVMAAIYRRALDALDASEQPPSWSDAADGVRQSPLAVAREVIAEAGHEALIENGNWVLLHRELPLELLTVG